MEISNIRIGGMILSLLGFYFSFSYFRGPKWRRENFLIALLGSCVLFFVSANPNFLTWTAEFFSLSLSERGRILALLIGSNIALWMLFVYQRGRFSWQKFQLDRLFRKLSARECLDIPDFKEKMKDIMIMMPAYNEADNLKILLDRIPQRILGHDVGILVIDDGSQDRTREVVLEKGFLCASNIINRGQGAASRLGYDILVENGATVIVTMDADNQHDPKDLPKLIAPILDDKYDLVIGSRVLGDAEKQNAVRAAGVSVLSRVLAFLTGKKLTDCSSGFKAFNSRSMHKIQLLEDQFQSSEVIIESIKRGLRVGEVPITINNRQLGESKKGTNLSYGFNFTKVLLATWWRN